MTVRTFDGRELPDGVFIASGTDPWVEVDGVPVDWKEKGGAPAEDNDCDVCSDMPVPGVIAPMNTPEGIERCDECERYPGDLEAALVLARTVGGIVRFEQDELEDSE